jgi:hypothetical protein
MTMLKTTLVLLLILAASSIAGAQNIAVTGSVRDASTGEPIVRATVRMLDGGRGTYTSREGKFRLPLPAGTHRIVVSSLGYESDTLVMTAGAGAVAVTLRPSTIELGEISVTAEMSAEDVVRSAIARKQENLARLETFSGLLYSKFALDIAGNAFGQIEDQDRATILETFSRYYYDRSERPPFQIEVVNRRQTANIPSEGNLFALGSFVSFYEDELPLLNARVMTPLAEDAFSRYRFELEGRTKLAGETVYIVKVILTTTVLPAFTGTMKIVKGTFNLVEVDLKPTEATAIAFVRDIRFVQRFERFEGSIWYPTFLEITGEASVEIVRGFQQIDAKLRATSIVTEGSVNKPIPDSVFSPRDADGDRRMITAAADADSARSEFWENNALSELTPEEKETYERIDSLVAETDTMARQEERGISFGFLPGIDYNRVGGLTLLGNVNVGLGSLVDVGVSGGYSFGLERPIAEANLVLTPLATDDVSLSLNASAFTRVGREREKAV